MRACIIGAAGELGQYTLQHAVGHSCEVAGVWRPRRMEKLRAYASRITLV